MVDAWASLFSALQHFAEVYVASQANTPSLELKAATIS